MSLVLLLVIVALGLVVASAVSARVPLWTAVLVLCFAELVRSLPIR